MYKAWEKIDTEFSVMSTKEYAKYLSELTGRSYTHNDITYMCRNNKLPKNATATKEPGSSLWEIMVRDAVVPKSAYIELADRYNYLLATVKAAGKILGDFIKLTETSYDDKKIYSENLVGEGMSTSVCNRQNHFR